MKSKNPCVSPIGFLDVQNDRGTLKSKRFFFLASILAIIIITSQFANASWLNDLFREDKVQQSPTPVTATLTVNSPPFVAKIAPVPAGFSLTTEPFQPIAGTGAISFHKLFAIQDADSINNIPANPQPITDFVGGISSPAALTPAPLQNPITIAFTQCLAVPCSTIPGFCPFPSNSIIYACSGINNFLSWYPPSQGTTSSANLWSAGLQVRDVTTGTFGPWGVSGSTPALSTVPDSYLQFNTIAGFSLTGSPTWLSLQPTATNQIASPPIVLTQEGNLPLQTVSITGERLIGNLGTNSFIPANAFKIGVDMSVCTNGLTLSTSNQQIFGASVPHTYTAYQADTLTLENCVAWGGPLSSYMQGPTSTTYTNAASPWVMDAT